MARPKFLVPHIFMEFLCISGFLCWTGWQLQRTSLLRVSLWYPRAQGRWDLLPLDVHSHNPNDTRYLFRDAVSENDAEINEGKKNRDPHCRVTGIQSWVEHTIPTCSMNLEVIPWLAGQRRESFRYWAPGHSLWRQKKQRRGSESCPTPSLAPRQWLPFFFFGAISWKSECFGYTLDHLGLQECFLHSWIFKTWFWSSKRTWWCVYSWAVVNSRTLANLRAPNCSPSALHAIIYTS